MTIPNKILRADVDQHGYPQFREISFEEHMAECVLFLIEEGINEDAHFRGVWEENVTADALEGVIRDPEAMTRILNIMRPGLQELLENVLDDHRKAEDKQARIEEEIEKTRLGIPERRID